MGIRRQVLKVGGFECVDCGHVSRANEVDHMTPLEQGGTDADSNLCVRCPTCHAAKTAQENRSRHGTS